MASTEQALHCYRHPNVETYVSCSNCERPICTDCMVQTAVGIKCPECAGQPAGVARATRRARAAAGDSSGLYVTKTLIGLNVLVFLVQLAQGPTSGDLFVRGALYGPAIAEGEWWRVVTSGFLHASLIHVGFNMLILWWFGGPIEALLGRGRFITIYGLSLLGGAAGAILLDPAVYTVGASGAIFGILGSAFLLERRGFAMFGGAPLVLIVLNLALSVIVGQISLGGHLGGLVAGMLATLAFMHFSRSNPAYSKIDAPTVLGLVAIGVGSLVLIWARVRGYAA